jgi:hypothetical protein
MIGMRHIGDTIGGRIAVGGRRRALLITVVLLLVAALGGWGLLRRLDPPPTFAAQLGPVAGRLATVATDLSPISASANPHSALGARAATIKRVGDVAQVRAADRSLISELGLPQP